MSHSKRRQRPKEMIGFPASCAIRSTVVSPVCSYAIIRVVDADERRLVLEGRPQVRNASIALPEFVLRIHEIRPGINQCTDDIGQLQLKLRGLERGATFSD